MKKILLSFFSWISILAVGFGAGVIACRFLPMDLKTVSDAIKNLAWITMAVQGIALTALTQVTTAVPGEDQMDRSEFGTLMELIEGARVIVFRAWIVGISTGLSFVAFSSLPEAFMKKVEPTWVVISLVVGLSFVGICALYRVGMVVFRLVKLRNDIRLQSANDIRRNKEIGELEESRKAMAESEKNN